MYEDPDREGSGHEEEPLSGSSRDRGGRRCLGGGEEGRGAESSESGISLSGFRAITEKEAGRCRSLKFLEVKTVSLGVSRFSLVKVF